MTRSLLYSLPEVPKSSVVPSRTRSKTMPELQSGQNVTATGTLPTTSLTISCHMRICSGYARASPLISRASTGSFGAIHRAAAAGVTNEGRSIAGMPSGGGPPEMISSRGTSALDVSVRSVSASPVTVASDAAVSSARLQRRIALQPRLLRPLGPQPVGALQQRIVIEYRDETIDGPTIAPRDRPEPLLLVGDVVVVAIGDAATWKRRLAGRHGNHEDRQQRAPLLVQEIGCLALVGLGQTRTGQVDSRRRVIRHRDPHARAGLEPLRHLARVGRGELRRPLDL